ncbi:YbaB/EbfC family nucleoid-associated protein [Streptomyces sp. NBC_01218]|uniref:YbaB/EbfC family nucleoid-associated protein n=1 Tax=unclassified Streptomyces TaxID=2593676 RepID=UPI0023B9C2F0|nr:MULTISPECIES: YbaB/EbfC family nucleoid-associated protein [unclassified Streptomyces]WEH43417.1 YbaB/EbfC family nucleoid-associated protein [Streptomyces sp. AM 2-1-1]WSQ55053.1 YbaB/EbfC family nucleoid-associated protein [Streptomyces sp. NBC_01218]
MRESIDDRVARAMAELAATEAAVGRAEERLRQVSVTVSSKDRSVRVTVGPQGEVTHLEFLDGKYRTMGATGLAAVVMEALREARTRMGREVVDTLRPLVESAPGRPASARLDVDWEKLFGSEAAGAGETAAGAAPPSPSRFRDELYDDDGYGRTR